MTAEPPQGVHSDTAETPHDLSHGPTGPSARGARRTRMGGIWIVAAFFALVLLLLLIFILENSQQVNISYFGMHGHSTLGVALLLAAILGVLLIAIPAAWRIIRLRRAAHKQPSAGAQ